MGRLFLIDLEGKLYSCKHCQTPLAHAEHYVSTGSHFSYGLAYVFHKVVNVSYGEREERMIMPGFDDSTIILIYCVKCGSNVGWKFESAYDLNPWETTIMLPRSEVLVPGEVPNMRLPARS
ncbi:unnamed protein product [Lathyrus oleraceus]|uniref:Protein yippee-like n=1 Tax=Pisum sativum TaxID=3888 RepID=A0A9D4XZR7_PEA|nr:protein yippee-like At3g11230 [Pisum sativum]KAI5429537.1 hypothetical protein KIW84_034209 [Pisum sativum]